MSETTEPRAMQAAAAKEALEPAHLGIQEVARALGVTHRTLRFYEDNGLISPARMGSARVYSRRDLGRMQLVLRGKRLGFTIRQIKEFLDLYDADPDQHEQMKLLLDKVGERLAGLEKQQAAIEETIAELREIEQQVIERLDRAAPGRARSGRR